MKIYLWRKSIYYNWINEKLIQKKVIIFFTNPIILSAKGTLTAQIKENVIENRIYVSYSYRNKFIYPLKYHFGRILAAILTSMMFTLLLRVISLMRYEQRKKLINVVSVHKNGIEKTKRVLKFNNEQSILLRRALMCIICWGLSLLYAIYCIGFASIYKHTQKFWIYIVIWSVLFEWFVFAPIYICVVCIVQVKGNKELGYYLNKLAII